MKKIKTNHLKEIAQLIQNGFDLKTTLSLMESLYGIDFKQYEIYEQKGEGVVSLLQSMLDIPLYQEMLGFYIQYLPLDEAILESVEIVEKVDYFKKKMIHILMYPSILLITILAFSLLVTFYLKPQFLAFYDSFEIELSTFHLWGMNLLFYLPFLIFILIIMIIYMVIDLYLVFKNNQLNKLFQYLKVPLISELLRIYISLRMMIYLLQFEKNKIPMNEMIQFLKMKTTDQMIETIAYELEAALLQGKSLEETIQSSIYFQDYFKVNIILSLSLTNKEVIYENYIHTTFNYIESYIERFKNILMPLIYGFVGIYIVGIYALLVVPMTNMLEYF